MPNPRKRQHKDTPPDFQKKKRKIGKGKQPAENVTQLNFKSGSIFVPTQLADSSADEPTTYRKLGLQALLTQLKHHNCSTRVSAFHGLRDLLQSNPDCLPSNLVKLIEQVMVAIVDQSAQVRHALSTLLSLIVDKTPVEKFSPFSSLIVAHLSCGLTHIDEQIQIDTLKTLDLFVSKPALIAHHVHTILPLLIKLISRQKTSSSSSTPQTSLLGYFRGLFSKQKGGSLVSNPDSKLADHSSRLQILLLLSRLLEALLSSYEAERTDSQIETSGIGPTIDVVNKRVSIPKQTSVTFVNFSSLIPHIPLFRSSGLYLPTSHGMFPTGSATSSFDESSWSELSIPSLLSLLLESWVDSSPDGITTSSKGSKKFALLEAILQLILTILHLSSFAQKNSTANESSSTSSLRKLFVKFWGEFQAHFLPQFPFSSQVSLDGPGFFHTALDLKLCQITTKLLEIAPSVSAQEKKNVLTRLTSLLSSVSSLKISDKQNLKTQEFQTCVQVLTEVYLFLVSTISSPEVLSSESLSGVTVSLWKTYVWSHPLSKSKQLLHRCFGKLLQSKLRKDLRLMITAELLLPWLQSIPDFLRECEDVTSVTLVLDSLLGGVECVSAEMTGEMEKIVTAIFSVTSILQLLPPNAQRQCVALVWLIPAQAFFQSESLVSITRAVQCGTVDRDVAVYLVQTVHHKFSRQCSIEAQAKTAGPYLSFMLSLIIGHSCEELRDCSSGDKITRLTPPLFNVVQSGRSSSQNKLVKAVCECLLVSPISSEVLHLVQNALMGLSEVSLCLPLNAVKGLLTLGVSLVPLAVPVISKHISLFFARFCFTLLVAMETSPVLSTQDPTISKLTNQMLECSELILDSLLVELPQQLSREQQCGQLSNVTAILKVMVSLMSSRLVHRSEAAVRSVRSAVGQVVVAESDNMDDETGRLIAQLRLMCTNLAMHD